MNLFDSFLINLCHNISLEYPKVNVFMGFIGSNDFIKGGIVISLLWFFWFESQKNLIIRKKVIITLLSCLIAIMVGRLLAQILPFRIRPLLDPQLSFLFPPLSFEQSRWLDSASSMPSDHAVMFYSLATGIFLISKKIGAFTFLYVSIVILLPRIFLGYHYPTDILTGGVVGILITLIFSNKKISDSVTTKAMEFSSSHSGTFYLLFFWLSFEIGTMFNSFRDIESHLITFIYNIF